MCRLTSVEKSRYTNFNRLCMSAAAINLHHATRNRLSFPEPTPPPDLSRHHSAQPNHAFKHHTPDPHVSIVTSRVKENMSTNWRSAYSTAMQNRTPANDRKLCKHARRTIQLRTLELPHETADIQLIEREELDEASRQLTLHELGQLPRPKQ